LDLKRKYKLILVAGARPNFMKIAPIIRELRKDRDQKTEDRCQEKTDVRGQRSEVRDQKTGERGKRK
jgi:hypothetical protein